MIGRISRKIRKKIHLFEVFIGKKKKRKNKRSKEQNASSAIVSSLQETRFYSCIWDHVLTRVKRDKQGNWKNNTLKPLVNTTGFSRFDTCQPRSIFGHASISCRVIQTISFCQSQKKQLANGYY